MPRQPRPAVPAHLAPMLTSWELSMTAESMSPKTRTIYLDAARWLAGSVTPDTPWETIAQDVTHLRLFFAGLDAAGYAAGYRNNIGRALQQFFVWLAAEEDLPNPFGAKLKVPRPPKLDENPPPVIAVEHLAALLRDAERGKSFEDRRDAAILRLFAATGSRLAELAGLEVPDGAPVATARAGTINVAAREATIRGKAGKVRTVRFDHKAALALDRYLRVRTKHPHAATVRGLWLGIRRREAMTPKGIYQVVRRRGRRLGLDIHPHLFRHTFTDRWLDAGGAEGDLMELLGWDSPAMLRHYGRSARGARARRAYDRVDVMGGV